MIVRKKRRKGLIIICGLSLFLYLFIKIITAIITTNKSFQEDLPSTYLLPSDDSSLIKGLYQKKIAVNIIHNSKVRGPISMLFFDQDYHIIIYKISLKENLSFPNFFHTQIKNASRSVNYPYSLYGENIFFYFQCKTGLTLPASEVYLTLNGDSLKTIIENDTVIAYHLLCKNFSVRYEEKGPVDIFVIGKKGFLGRTPLIPMDILLLRRQKNVYLLLLTPNNQNQVVPPELLYNIIEK